MSKRLQIDYVRVNKVQFGETTNLTDGVLTVNKEELMDMANRAAVFWEFMISCSRAVRRTRRRHPIRGSGES